MKRIAILFGLLCGSVLLANPVFANDTAQLQCEAQAAGVFAEPDASLGDLVDVVTLQLAALGDDAEEVLVDTVDGGLHDRQFLGGCGAMLGQQVGVTGGLHAVGAELHLLR